MSQRGEWSARDREAAAAVVRHHAHLAATLDRRVEALLGFADAMDSGRAEQARRELLEYLHAELLPHARAEEEALYPAAAALAEGKPLIEGMVGEHHAIANLVDELAKAAAPVRAAAAGRALAAVFATHLAKEDELVVPLIGEAGKTSLADLLEGMHALLGPSEHA